MKKQIITLVLFCLSFIASAAVDPITGDLSVCLGSAATLSSATPGGIWSSSSLFVATVGSASGVVVGIDPGTATITYTVGAEHVAAVVTINALPGSITGPSSVCHGSFTFLGNATPGGTWASSSGNASVDAVTGVVTGVAPGNSTITYTVPSGCYKTKMVTVYPLPSLPDTIVVCEGSYMELAWLGGGTWSTANPSIASVAGWGSPLLGGSVGVTTLTHTLPTGCQATATVIVTATTTPLITGSLGVCIGSYTTLANATPGGTWATSAPGVATIDGTGLVTSVAIGTAGVTYTPPGIGCPRHSVVTVNPLPAPIVGADAICNLASSVYTSTSLGGIWSTGNPAIVTIGLTNGVAIAHTLDTVDITYTLSTGCQRSKSVYGILAPYAISGPDEVCVGETITLSNPIGGGVWSSSNPAVVSVDFLSSGFIGVTPGTATLTYVLSTGCYSTHTVSVNTLSTPITGALGLCSATGTTLANATPGGVWSSSNTSVAIVGSTGFVNGAGTGTAVISYSTPLSCTATAVVSVNGLTGISGEGYVCIGGTTTLSHSVDGGSWSSDDPSVVTVDATTGEVTGVTAGTATITYTSSCGTYTKPITVIVAIPEIVGVDAFCESTFTAYTNAAPGGTWSGHMPLVISSDGVAAGLLPGTSTITYTLAGCGSVTKAVTVHPIAPPITGPYQVCVGSAAVYTSSATGSTWSVADGESASIDASTGLLLASEAGGVIIKNTLTTGCVGSRYVTVNPNPSDVSGSPVVCVGSSVVYNSSSPGGIWTSADPSIAAVNSLGVVSGVAAGTATLAYTLATGCRATSVVSVQPAVGGSITGATSVCLGNSISLSHPISGGTWTSASSSRVSINPGTGEAVGVGIGTTTVSYFPTAGCYSTSTITVAGPAAIYGSANVCTGYTTTFTNATSGGTWSSSDAAVASVDVSGVVTGVSPGTALISYALPCGTATRTVSVSATSPLITGDASLCVASSSELHNAFPLGTWSSSNTSVATIHPSLGTISPLTAGTVTFSYTYSFCPAQTKGATVNPLPADITGGTSVCVGASLMLANDTPGGVWSSPESTIVSVDAATGVIFGLSPGTATISYTSIAGCSKSMTEYVNPAPVTEGGSALCVGGTLTLSTTIPGTWSGSDAVATVYDGGLVTGLTAGSAVLTITANGTGCIRTHTVTATSLCSGMPGASVAVAEDTSICAGAVAELSLSGIEVGCGMSCQWQYADGEGWANISGATNTNYSAIVSDTRAFRCGVTCIASHLTRYSSPVTVHTTFSIADHSIVATPDVSCGASHFHISTCGASHDLSITTYFGDGTSDTTPLAAPGLSEAEIYHTYASPGTYSIKHVLSKDTVAIDSVTFSYDYNYCRTMSVAFYHDNNSNCVFDVASEFLNTVPIVTEIDSNGVPIDTITAISGFYKKVYGIPGTVYGFRVLSAAGGATLSPCVIGGILYDTISIYTNTYATKFIPVICDAVTGHDLSVVTSMVCRPNMATGNIVVSNARCQPVAPTVTFTFSPKYSFYYSNISPSSVVGNTVTWNLGSLSSTAVSLRNISVSLRRLGGSAAWLPLGDTIHSQVSVGPTAGDLNTANNVEVRLDTVRAGYDPNDIVVTPEGYILSCTELQYRVRFENMGNDTAYNIHILDTLSEFLDPGTLEPVIASAPMNISILYEGGYTIARFDFPNINLADSSHPDENKGVVYFKIKARNGLADNTIIRNRAGIYFDYSPVVMTNEVANETGLPPIQGTDSVCAGAEVVFSNPMQGGVWASANSGADVVGGLVSGVTYGMDTISYTTATSCVSQTRTREIFVNEVPVVAAIMGVSPLCAGDADTLTNATANGEWSSEAPSVAVVSGVGIVSASSFGTTIVSYIVSNTCGVGYDTATVHVDSLLTPAVSVTADYTGVLCAGTSVVFTAHPTNEGTAPIYTWLVNGSVVTSGTDTFAVTPADADNVAISLESNAVCATIDVVSDNITVVVTDNVLPSVGISSAHSGAVCQGDAVTFMATATGAGTAPTYQWVNNGTVAGGGSTYTYVPVNGDEVYCRLMSSLPCLIEDTVVTGITTLSVDSAYIPVVSLDATPGFTIVDGQYDTLIATVTGAGSTPTYQWRINSVDVPGATSNVFVSNSLSNGDSVTCFVTGSGVCAYHSFNSVYINVTSLGISSLSAGANLMLAPNPNQGGFSLKGKVGGQLPESATIEITNLLGQKMYVQDVVVSSGLVDVRIDLPDQLANGVYILTLRAGNQNNMLRFVVNR